ncbi:MAG: choice-of-anchor C family protein [Burkholderiales bacterium]
MAASVVVIDGLRKVIGLAIGLGVGGLAAAASFQNGSFESSSIDPGFGVYLAAPNMEIDGWEVTGGAVHYSHDLWQYADGVRGLEMNGGDAGTIAQVFDTVPGLGYHVIFAMAGNPDRETLCCGGAANSPLVKTLRVSAAGVSLDYAFDVSEKTATDMQWTDMSFTFTATDSITTLTFQSLTASAFFGPTLDNVRVAAVPEPSEWILLVAGTVALIRSVRTRSRMRA